MFEMDRQEIVFDGNQFEMIPPYRDTFSTFHEDEDPHYENM